MTRVEALAWLAGQYADFTTALGRATGDTTDGYGPCLDEAYMKLGTAYADLAEAGTADTDDAALRAALRVTATEMFLRSLAMRVDLEVEDPGISKKWSQATTQLTALHTAAVSDWERLGYDDNGSWEHGTLGGWGQHYEMPAEEGF